MNTMDIDIVHSRNPENLERLMQALSELDASYRLRSDLKITPNESHLRSPGHQLLRTIHGDLDVLGTIGKGLSYEDLQPFAARLDVGDGIEVLSLNLDKYVELKEELSRDKDRAALPILRAALKEKRGLPT